MKGLSDKRRASRLTKTVAPLETHGLRGRASILPWRREVGDQLDGKAAVIVTCENEVWRAQDLSDDELAAIIAEGRQLTEKDDSVH
jgi:hypothetical protein